MQEDNKNKGLSWEKENINEQISQENKIYGEIKEKKFNFRKPNPILLLIRNIAKFILSEYYFCSKEPDFDFKNLSITNFILELNNHKGKEIKILLKKHSLVIEEIRDKWEEISSTHSFLSDSDKILQYLLDKGWKEEAARSNLLWLINKTYMILSLHFEDSEKTKVHLQKDFNLPEALINAILAEIKCDDLFLVCYSSNKGLRIYS